MITRLWMDEDGGAMSLIVELDNGDGGLFELDLRNDPPTSVDLSAFEPADHWVEMVPDHGMCIPLEQA